MEPPPRAHSTHKKTIFKCFMGVPQPLTPLIGAGGGQDFLATGHGRWYRDSPSDQTTGVDEDGHTLSQRERPQ
jgi:hypothetical protein